MKIETMGRVTVEATFENLEDLWAVERGLIPEGQPRSLIVRQAVVDPEAVFVSLPAGMMNSLGLDQQNVLRLTIQGRSCTMEVKPAAEGAVASIGHLALTHLDLVVDPVNRTLTGNPAHGGEQIYELY